MISAMAPLKSTGSTRVAPSGEQNIAGLECHRTAVGVLEDVALPIIKHARRLRKRLPAGRGDIFFGPVLIDGRMKARISAPVSAGKFPCLVFTSASPEQGASNGWIMRPSNCERCAMLEHSSIRLGVA